MISNNEINYDGNHIKNTKIRKKDVFKAAFDGDINLTYDLIYQDKKLIDTAFHAAALAGYKEFALQLFDEGVSNIKDVILDTALEGHIELTLALLEKEGSIDARLRSGRRRPYRACP